jgi:hypothetical protein
MSAFDLLPLFLPAAMVGSALGAQSFGAAVVRAVRYRKRGGLRFASVGRLSVSWSIRSSK